MPIRSVSEITSGIDRRERLSIVNVAAITLKGCYSINMVVAEDCIEQQFFGAKPNINMISIDIEVDYQEVCAACRQVAIVN